MFILVILSHGKYYIDVSEVINSFCLSLDCLKITDWNQLSSNLLSLALNLTNYVKLPGIIYDFFISCDCEYERALLHLNELIQESIDFRNNTLIPDVMSVWNRYLTIISEGFLHNYSSEMFDLSYPDGSTYEGHMLDLLYHVAESRHNFQIYGDMIRTIAQQVQFIENRFNVTLDYEFTPIEFEPHITWFITRTHYFMEDDMSTPLADLYTRTFSESRYFFNRMSILMMGYDNLIPMQTFVIMIFIRTWEIYFGMLVSLYWI